MKSSFFTFMSAATLACCQLSFNATADSISDFNNAWEGQALASQRLLDIYSPIIDNNILGTHNSYNSEKYRSCNFSVGCRYLDPQQKHTLQEQLLMGARFIELDVHWTAKMESLFSYPKRLLLCHGFCSLNDKYFTEGLNEIKNWLNSDASEDQVVILYIEDHMEGHHTDAFNQINDRFGEWIYQSQGCQSIADSLTKADVIAAGKKVILWGDGGCSSQSDWENMAFTGLGNVGRIWEDRTTARSIGNIFTGGSDDYITDTDVKDYFQQGANIVNLDDMVVSDNRLAAGIWSWDTNEPNNVGDSQHCALQWANGRWDDQFCGNDYAYACYDEQNKLWQVTDNTGTWDGGEQACQALGTNIHFNVPTNGFDNEKLKAVKEAKSHAQVWLDYSDQAAEGQWQVNGLTPSEL
ncbi:phosphatidylinositol-specific phospholipase C domain-containing protein [Shewanella surugensis]|uniref:Phosphatidylinositol-specific phospholipase C domain-containing protein n=1 Tax=Shewanella surugensis TaxID=212020 RepID=A0ABT0LHU7_9GAMM|nr:phosphatidylinositol-specific phospholipase C domain-containing protein [Shewanella surugensis]MCL1127149.1 phosphatidylinositol-specific phospholipase C domain-containing protein [Shewanella surugensis]